jgi:hypothetical protein
VRTNRTEASRLEAPLPNLWPTLFTAEQGIQAGLLSLAVGDSRACRPKITCRFTGRRTCLPPPLATPNQKLDSQAAPNWKTKGRGEGYRRHEPELNQFVGARSKPGRWAVGSKVYSCSSRHPLLCRRPSQWIWADQPLWTCLQCAPNHRARATSSCWSNDHDPRRQALCLWRACSFTHAAAAGCRFIRAGFDQTALVKAGDDRGYPPPSIFP